MKYNAITFDTNIFRQRGYNFEGGLLEQLSQFNEHGISLVLSEIVWSELRKHLSKQIENTNQALKKAIHDAQKHNLLVPPLYEQLNASLDENSDLGKLVQKKMDDFFNNLGFIYVPVTRTEVKKLVDMYFQSSPPFDRDGKKSEFPDAIALLSLEKWADENNLRMLAISDDVDWKNYAQNSKRISIEKDLAAALENIQRNVPLVRNTITRLITKLEAGEYASQRKKIDDYISGKLNDVLVNFSPLDPIQRFTEEIKLLNYAGFEFKKDNKGYKFYVIHAEKNKIIIKVSLIISADILYEMRAYDSPIFDDEDRWITGCQSLNDHIRFDASILLDFSGDLTNDSQEISIKAVEFNCDPLYFDLSSPTFFNSSPMKNAFQR